MKKLTTFLTVVILFISQVSFADEGMWLLTMLNKNYEKMQQMGLKLKPEDIYNPNGSSLKDAVITLDHGNCTGEIVSKMGLILTNHHCGYEEIQQHSSVDADYLTDGFWAYSLEEELPNPGKTISFLVRIEDVTSKISWKLNDKMTEEMRQSVIEKSKTEIEKQASEGGKYDAAVVELYGGNEYYLFVYVTYKDVRLVGAPPSSIGKFGGDTDNWMWPRHTGDFSMFRVYAAPDGSPAEYSPENVPLKTPKFFKISISGIKEGDFSMIMGYPGTTNRYLTSFEITETMNHENAIRYKVRTEKLNILKSYMDKSDKTRIQYASKYAQSANYWKYSEGQNLGLNRLNVIKRTQAFEKDFQKWIKKDKERKAKFGTLLQDIQKSVSTRNLADIALNYWFEAVYQGPEIFLFVLKNFGKINRIAEDTDISELVKELREEGKTFFKDYDPSVDKELFAKLVKMYFDNVDSKYKGELFNDLQSKYSGDINKMADEVYTKSIFADEKRYMEALDNFNPETIKNDIGIVITYSMLNTYWGINDEKDSQSGEYSKYRRLFFEAYLKYFAEKDPKKPIYPDASSTMRLTYGTVGGYSFEGKKYDWFTTLDQYIAKENPKNEEFYVKPRTKELYNAKDFGRYAGKDGVMYVNFITNNDITGGNSGSPVINGNGELIGIAFDGNWEGMSGDIAFEPQLQKTICVDIRYVLWTIDKYANAQNLINEMTIVQ